MSFAFFWEMSWKSALIIGAALSLAALLRSRSPADRAAILRLGVSLLLLLPLIALLLPALQIETPAETLAPLPPEAYALQDAPVEIAPLQPVPATIWDDPSSLIAILYLGGLLMVASRILGGLLTLRRWTRAARPLTDPIWLAAMERTVPQGRGGDAIRLLVSDEAPTPLSWGWLRPVILIDRDTLDRPEDADAVLAHEVAHVVRRDWPALMMTRLSVALFWFNPLVWLLERELVQQAEEAADCAALGCVEPAHYAQTLVSCAQTLRLSAVPANSMAPRASGLRKRVSAILDGRAAARSGSFWTVAAMMGCAAFAAPLAAIELVPAVAELSDFEAPAVPPAPPMPLAAPVPSAPRAAVAALAPAAPLAPAAALAAARAPAPPVLPAAPAAPEMIEVRAVNVDVPETLVDVPEVNVNANGVRVHVPAIKVRVPQVRVNVPAMRIAMPPIPPVPPIAMGMHFQGWSAQDRAEWQAEMREARREVAREAAEARAEARAEADADSRERIREARQEAARARAHATQQVRVAHREVAKGAAGMERGADGMVRGARQMEEEADRLRDPAYRARQIAREAARGRTVTDQELIDAIPKLREGARKMLAGAERMRESAGRMRRQGM
jgi:beta-lactamase regulating signal transducer with metallopeptidase domain